MYPREYIHYLVHFHCDRDYFECHEILEEYWKRVDKGNKFSIFIAFIQLAVSNYHHRRDNFEGAKKTLKKAIYLFQLNKSKISELGLDSTSLFQIITSQLIRIEKRLPYESYEFPFADPSLLNDCINICKQHGLTWGMPSNLSNLQLVHRHLLRDRSNVIQERENAKIIRKTWRSPSP
ncbi:MAG: DUF309 domain-containing protein [Bacillota bacterium]|nr:DUF309 domain-containing protein [Bacillota bacterium]